MSLKQHRDAKLSGFGDKPLEPFFLHITENLNTLFCICGEETPWERICLQVGQFEKIESVTTSDGYCWPVALFFEESTGNLFIVTIPKDDDRSIAFYSQSGDWSNADYIALRLTQAAEKVLLPDKVH